MKKLLLLLAVVCVSGALFAQTDTCSTKQVKKHKNDTIIDGKVAKRGWNFGILPSVAYDADYGFQGGLLGNVYFYGDGTQYPEYIHSLYAEAAYTTKHHGIFRFNYDSKYLIPNHRLTLDATYLPDAMCDFYGFNGYNSVYNNSWHFWKKKTEKMSNPEDYLSRVFYKYKRDLIRVAADIEGTIYKDLKWNAGIGVLGYIIEECDINMLNGKNVYDPSKEKYAQKALDPDVETLYEKYVNWGLIGEDEKKGGWHPYARVGITYDTRDRRQGPTKGIYTDAFFTYSAAFNAKYGQQATAGYNHLQFNFAFRHYVPCYKDRIIFAYRIGTQNNVAGHSPFYMNTYLNTLFIQRVYYEGLGGGNSVRGMMANRINADGFAFANIEFRFRIVNFDIGRQHFFIGLNPFFDLGIVTQPYKIDFDQLKNNIDACNAANGTTDKFEDYFTTSKSDLYRPHMCAGIGLKVGMNENFVLSADWGMPINEKYYMGQDNAKYSNFYVKMGYLF